MERLEQILQSSSPSKPTPFDIFCQQKLNEFRHLAKNQISSKAPAQAKLQKLVELIESLHAPNCRGKNSTFIRSIESTIIE